MELTKILDDIAEKFYKSRAFIDNQEFFSKNNHHHRTLALNYIINQFKDSDLFYLCALNPEFRQIKAKDRNNIDLLSEDSINQFILDYKDDIREQRKFNQEFIKYLLNNRPDWVKLITEWTAEVLHKIPANSLNVIVSEYDSSLAEITKRVMLYILNSFTAADIFEIMSSDNIEFLKTKLRNLQAVISDMAIENLAHKNEVKKHTKEKPQPITRKANLILLLDFCNEFLKLNPKAKPEKIIKAFEDEKRYFGGWKSWEPFFIDNFETIKCLTAIPINKKMDGLFAINNRRDQIDKLYAVIERSHFFR